MSISRPVPVAEHYSPSAQPRRTGYVRDGRQGIHQRREDRANGRHHASGATRFDSRRAPIPGVEPLDQRAAIIARPSKASTERGRRAGGAPRLSWSRRRNRRSCSVMTSAQSGGICHTCPGRLPHHLARIPCGGARHSHRIAGIAPGRGSRSTRSFGTIQ